MTRADLPKKIYHYSGKPINRIDINFYKDKKGEWPKELSRFKPRGFWVSIEDFQNDITWYDWCINEGFRTEDLNNKYLVKLKDNSNILFLNNVDDIIDFSLKNVDNEYLKTVTPQTIKDGDHYIYLLDWIALSKRYDGIIIAPYQWSLRLDEPATSWYYGWDCSSGCIWNLETIESLTLENEK